MLPFELLQRTTSTIHVCPFFSIRIVYAARFPNPGKHFSCKQSHCILFLRSSTELPTKEFASRICIFSNHFSPCVNSFAHNILKVSKRNRKTAKKANMEYQDFLIFTGKVITLEIEQRDKQEEISPAVVGRQKKSKKTSNKKKKKTSKSTNKTKKSNPKQCPQQDGSSHEISDERYTVRHTKTSTPANSNSVKSKRKFSFSEFLMSPTMMATPRTPRTTSTMIDDDATCSTQSLSYCDESSLSFSCDDLSSSAHPHGSGSIGSNDLYSPFHHNRYNLTPRTPIISNANADPMKDKKKKKSYLKRNQGRDRVTSNCRKNFLKDRISSIIDKEDAFAMLMVHEFQEMGW